LVDASERDFEASLMRAVFLTNSPDYLCVRPRGRVFSVHPRIRFSSAKYGFVGAITRQLTMSMDCPELILFRRSDITIDEFHKSKHINEFIELKIYDQMQHHIWHYGTDPVADGDGSRGALPLCRSK
jgi:hypothetical protein